MFTDGSLRMGVGGHYRNTRRIGSNFDGDKSFFYIGFSKALSAGWAMRILTLASFAIAGAFVWSALR